LAFYAFNHSATHSSIKERAEKLCSDLETQISPENVEELRVLVQNKTIEDITNEILESQ